MDTINIKQNWMDEPIRTRLTGARFTVAVGCAMLATVFLADISWQLDRMNNQKAQEIKIQRQQLELQQRQHALDSVRYVNAHRNMHER